jgi:hypothetical protein
MKQVCFLWRVINCKNNYLILFSAPNYGSFTLAPMWMDNNLNL